MRYGYGDIRATANRLRCIPLESVLRIAGAQQDRHDKAKWHTPQGVLSVTGVKFMDWAQGSGGGGAIDLVIHLFDLDFLSALDWLSRHFPAAQSTCDVSSRLSSAGKPLRLPFRDDGELPCVKRYLLDVRKLSPDLLLSLIACGRLYADNRGNAVFLLLGKGSRPVGAELRGTTHHQWRGMAPGSQKDAGYFSVPPIPHAQTIVLCESAIDAISCATLHPDYLCISTAGARANPRWLANYVSRGRVYCGFDADEAGDRMAAAMIAHYPTVQRLRPPLHDWNDTLRLQS